MSELFNFENVDDNVSTGERQYIYPGIYNNVVIKKVSHVEKPENGGAPYIELELYAKAGGPDNSKAFRLYTSERALEGSMKRLKHLAKRVATEQEVNSIKSIEDFNDLLRGRSVRMKFCGEQYEYNGEVKEKATIGYLPFAEAIEEGAAVPVVADEDTQLTYDKNNKYDFKMLATSSSPSPMADERPTQNGNTPAF